MGAKPAMPNVMQYNTIREQEELQQFCKCFLLNTKQRKLYYKAK